MSYERQRTTRKLDTSTPFYPVKDQDDYSPHDHNRDGVYADAKLGDTIREIFDTIPAIVSGGIVTDGGGGTLDITALVAISEIDEEIENGIFATDVVRVFSINALTGWMDTNANDTGATNYIKCYYNAVDHTDTRDYLYRSGTYNYKQIDSYVLKADITPPVAGEVCLGEFTKVSGTITGITIVNRSPDSVLVNSLMRVRGDSGTTYGRRRLNVISGDNISVSVSDDSVDEEIELTINSTSISYDYITDIINVFGLEFGLLSGTLGVTIAYFPPSGSPVGRIVFPAKKTSSSDDINFTLVYFVDAIDSGVVKLDADVYVNGSSIGSLTETINPIDTGAVGKLLLTTIKVLATNYSDDDIVRIDFSRDNSVGSNHLARFGLLAILVT